MYKKKTLTGLLSGIGLALGATAVNAASFAEVQGTIDWSAMSAGGVSVTPATVNNDPWTPGVTYGPGWSDAGVEVNGVEEDYQESTSGGNVSASYSDAVVTVSGSFDGVISAAASSDRQSEGSGWAGSFGFRGAFFTADSDGIISFSVPYTASIDMLVDDTHSFSWASGGFSAYFGLVNWNEFINGLPAVPADQVTEQQEDDAFLAALVGEDFAESFDEYWDYNGCDPTLNPCGLTALDDAGFLTIEGAVTANETYFLIAELDSWVDTQVQDGAAVPVPGAVWLFGSGLLGLVGVARRRK